MFRLEMRTDNEAFTVDGWSEIARILRKYAGRIENGVEEGVIMDVNGNKIGKFKWTAKGASRWRS